MSWLPWDGFSFLWLYVVLSGYGSSFRITDKSDKFVTLSGAQEDLILSAGAEILSFSKSIRHCKASHLTKTDTPCKTLMIL